MSSIKLKIGNHKFVDEYLTSCATLTSAIKKHESTIEKSVYDLLTATFPERKFDESLVQAHGGTTELYVSESNKLASYQDNNMEFFVISSNGDIERKKTQLANSAELALFQAENSKNLFLLIKREGRNCFLSAFNKRSGNINITWGFRPIHRLVHVDSCGFEYIVMDGENCFLQSVKCKAAHAT